MTPIVAQQVQAGAGSPERTTPDRLALAGLSLSMLLSALGTSVANVGLPALAQAFAAPFQDVQWVVLAYLLAITALIVGAGRLGDIVGRRRLLLIGIGLFTAASGLSGLAPTLPLLVAARAVQGLGAAVMMALTLAFVGETVPKERTGSAMGLLGTMSAVGTALGPSLGGALIAGFGWRAMFLATVPLGGAAFLIAQRALPADRPRPAADRPGFDATGTALLALALAAYALAMTVGRGPFGPVNGALLAAGIGIGGLFVLSQAKAASPLIRLAMLREGALRDGLATGALVSTIVMATLVVGPFHLARGLGLDAAAVGLAMSAGPAVAALSGIPAGRLVDRFGPGPMTLAGLAGMAAGSGILSVAAAAGGIGGYVAPVVVVTAGYALVQAANTTAVMGGVPPERRGVVSGLLNLARNLGLITGASVMGAVFAGAAGAGDVANAQPAAVAAGTGITFAVATALALAAMAIVARGRARAARPSQPGGA